MQFLKVETVKALVIVIVFVTIPYVAGMSNAHMVFVVVVFAKPLFSSLNIDEI